MIALAQSYGIQKISKLDHNHPDIIEYGDATMPLEELESSVENENTLGIINHGRFYVLPINQRLAEIDFLHDMSKEHKLIRALLLGADREFETDGIRYAIRYSSDESTNEIQQRLNAFLLQSART